MLCGNFLSSFSVCCPSLYDKTDIESHQQFYNIYTMHGEEQKCDDLARALGRVVHADSRAPMNLDTIRLK